MMSTAHSDSLVGEGHPKCNPDKTIRVARRVCSPDSIGEVTSCSSLALSALRGRLEMALEHMSSSRCSLIVACTPSKIFGPQVSGTKSARFLSSSVKHPVMLLARKSAPRVLFSSHSQFCARRPVDRECMYSMDFSTVLHLLVC